MPRRYCGHKKQEEDYVWVSGYRDGKLVSSRRVDLRPSREAIERIRLEQIAAANHLWAATFNQTEETR